MVTSKCHKADEKTPNLRCTFICQFLGFTIKISPLNQDNFWECNRLYIFQKLITTWGTCTAVFGVLVSNPQKIYLLIELSIFRLILVPTRKERSRNQYMIIYLINKHHLTCTSVLTFFNRPFTIWSQMVYLATGSNLSWFKLIMVKIVVLQRKAVKIQQTIQLIKLVRPIMI